MEKFFPIQTSSMPLKDKLLNMLWKFVNATLFRYTPSYTTFFRKYRVALIRLFGAHVDWSASLHPTAKIDYPWNLSMGERASLGERSWTYAMNYIKIGRQSCIGKEVYLLTGSHDIESVHFDLVTRPITIGEGCWIATSSLVLPGITIGDFSVVAAASVVTKTIEPYTVVGGNPAKMIKKRQLE